MTSKDPNLKKLLNDESFIRWLKDEATVEERQKWDHWLNDDPEREIITQKAKKIATMPFVENDSVDIGEELWALRKEIMEKKKNLE
jgi:hypothetical protein